MRTRLGQTILFTVAFIVSITIHTAQGSDEVKLTGKVNNETGTKEFNLSASHLSSKTRLKIRSYVESGHVVWTLRDPSGKSWITAATSKDGFSLDWGPGRYSSESSKSSGCFSASTSRQRR
jgi:hypothetical protein